MGVMTVGSFVFDVLTDHPTLSVELTILATSSTHGSADGDTSCLLLWRLVDLRVIHELSTAGFREIFGDGSCESSLSMVDVLFGEYVQ
jgi:hypothetical protein